MSIIKPNNNTISAITALPAAIPTGKVLQVVQGTLSSEFNTTSTSYVDTGLDVSITPTSSSNKILVTCSFSSHNDGSNRTMYYTLYRDSTDLNSGNGSGFFSTYGQSGGGTSAGGNDITFLDSPNTTSQVEYSVYTKVSSGASYISIHGAISTITAMEIEA